MKKLLIGTLALGIATALCLTSVPVSAEPVGGPIRFTTLSIAPGQTHTFHVLCEAGELTQAFANGDGDIDIRVFDEDGVLVDADTLVDSAPLCGWVPPVLGIYTIEVTNADFYMVDYTLDVD